MQQNSSSPIPTPAYLPRDPLMASVDPTSFEWSDLLDFNLDETLYAPFPDIGPGSVPEQSQSPSESSGQIRKRDPRLVCSNFLAGRVPCACPELDELLEEAESGLPGKKRARVSRASGASPMRCQVPGCEVDISELKGYHKRHRVCLRCANASSVVLDGESKRYCQQCGKFHLLPDFDEGKRSCRRKLERHNNRRRRKPTDSKGGVEKEAQQVISADDVSTDYVGKDGICPNSQIEERELRLDPDGHVSTLCSALDSQNLGGDSVATIAAPGEERELRLEPDGHVSTLCSALDSQNLGGDSVATIAGPSEVYILGQNQNPKYNKRSPSYGDNKNAFSSLCPAGRISFKLYDWNPAEFPRRLRHQIFEWLASMPVELEGYIRPGCTILTAFIAMPKPIWLKLLEEPGICIKNLFASPGNLMSGRGTMLVYLNDIIFRVTKDGNSVVRIRVKDRSPKLHYIHPNCFVAGRPMEFVACGSNLLQPKFRFLVSFAGQYLAYNICVSSLCCTKGNINNFDHQLVKISVPQTDASLIGPAFVEVENQSGLSNFIPILIGDGETCAELEILQQKLETPSRPVCQDFAIRQAQYSEFLLDVAWSLKKPAPDQPLTSYHVQRFNHLSNFLIRKKSSVILDRVVCSMKPEIDKILVASGVSEAAMNALRENMRIAESMIGRRLTGKDFTVACKNVYSQKDKRFVVPASDTNMVGPGALSLTREDASSTDHLINREVVMNVINLHNTSRSKSCTPLIPRTFSTSRPIIMAIAVIGVCLGLCAVVLHPRGVGQIATTIRRCLFES